MNTGKNTGNCKTLKTTKWEFAEDTNHRDLYL